MAKKLLILISYVLLLTASLGGQCPSNNLWARLVYLRDSSKLPPKEQLNKLFSILDSINHCSYRADSTHSFLIGRIGKIYLEQGDYIKAVQYYQESIKIITKNEGKKTVNVSHLPGRYYWLSVAYDSLNNFTEKMKVLDSCIAVSMRLKFIDRSTLKSMETRVQYFFDVGDYQRCVDYAASWEALGREYAGNNIGIEHTVGEISIKSSLGWHVKALLQLKRFEQAEELLKNKIEEYRKEGLKDYLGMIYGQLAEVQEQKGDYSKALSYYDSSLKYYRDFGDYFNCKQTAKDIGNLYFKHFNDSDKAFAYYKKAFTFINKDRTRNTADVFESLNIFANIGNIYVEKSIYDSAYHYYQLAFDQIKPGTNENKILHSSADEFIRYKKIHYLTGLQIDKGDAFQKQYKSTRQKSTIQEAIRVYTKTDQLLDRIKTEQSELESKLFWRSDSRRLYEHAIEACYLNGSIDDGFYFFEKSRAVLLQDQLNEQRWVGEKDILNQTQIKKKILQLERDLNKTDKSSKRHSELENELFSSRQELERLKKLIKINNPLYYQNFVDENIITVKDVQQRILKNHQALVELFVGDSAVYILAITAQKSFLQKIDKPDFDRLSDSYRNYISKQDLLNKNFDAFRNQSLQLYQLIFKNINLPAGRIIISPDGKYFPFEALVTNNHLPTYFVEDHAVSYVYSARYLLNNFTTNSVLGSHPFLGMAPVQYSNGLATLTGSDQSLQRMQNYFNNGTTLLGNKASKNSFISQFPNYKIIQLYTHATDGGSTGEPMIYFSDSILSLSDLFYENRPATSLIVLSACETASGKLYNGEGVFSFNRGFAALGIPSSVSNLWEIDNQSTYQLTELFYKYVADGLPLDLALQKAKKEFIKSSDNKLPYYWAASILVGQSNAISLQKTFPWKWITASVILLILVFLGWRIKRRMNSTQLRVKRELLHP
jgi:CHAT domain-containing protein/tetratricopeptide (TPR) repeat protein